MFVLGLILIAAGAVLGVLAFLAATPATQTIELTQGGWTRASSPLELLIVGAAGALLVCLGWALIAATIRRRARIRREEREQERINELERSAATYKAEQEQRFEEARLRDEDFARREEAVTSRQTELDARAAELSRREAEWREREGPSVADVVTGRAEGRVSEGTATWGDESTRPVAHTTPEEARGHDETRLHDDTRPHDQTRVDEPRVREQRRTDDV